MEGKIENHFDTSQAEKIKLSDLLTQYHIPIDTWGKGEAKTIDHLANEIAAGETVLVEDEKSGKLIREFSFLAIIVLCQQAGKTYQLIEEKQVFADGRERVRRSDISVGEKIKQDEREVDEITKRALQEELGIEGDFIVREHKIIKEEVDSKSYPGLTSRRNRFDVIVEISPTQYKTEGYTEIQSDKSTYFAWKEI